MNRPPRTATSRSEFADALRKGLLIGAAVLTVVLPPVLTVAPPAKDPQVAVRPAPTVPAPRSRRLADFAGRKPSQDVRRMAHWVVQSGDHGRMAFVIVDKKDSKVYAFDPRGRLQSVVPALLGSARGDHTVPGIGDKPIAQVLPEERTTPAGRFVAEMGMSSSRGEDVVWVDYDAAVSMHRVLKAPERLQALSSPSNEDNRMSYGCINLPDSFFEDVLRPLVKGTGAVIYVLPETRPLHEVFASFYDVTAPMKVAHTKGV
ncbi:MAG: hypothetical protein ACYC0T_06425 [Ramlibacter sp.]